MKFATRRMQENGATGGRPADGRDAEIERLKGELERAQARERATRAALSEAHRRFDELRSTGRAFAATMHETSAARRRSRQRIAAQYAVGRVLAEAGEIEEASESILRTLVRELGSSLGAYWSMQDNRLGLHTLWPAPDDHREETFEEACRRLSLRRDEGLPGRAWAAGRPVWIEDVLADEHFLRRSAAEASGLRSALAFPARDGGRTAGVFELFWDEVAPPDEELLRVTSAIGGQIGQFAERRRAEKGREIILHRERRAHAEAEAARRRTVEVLESMGDAFFSFDPDWRFTYINAAAAEMVRGIGKDPDGLLGRVVWEGIPEISGTKFETEMRRAARNKEVVEYEEYLRPLDKWLGGRVYPSEGGVSTYIRDVTEGRRAREALRRNEERWRTLIEKGADVITISDRDGTIRFASPSIEAVCGHPVEEFVGSNPLADGHVHPDDLERCREAFGELEDNPGHSVTIQHRYRHESGEWRWLEGTFTNLFEDPTIGGLVANFRDVTERKQAEEDARRAAERDAFGVALADALRPLTDPVEIQSAALRVVGERLAVDRALYAEIEDDETIKIDDNYVRGDSPKLIGRFAASDFGTASEILRAGQTFATSDVNRDENLPEAEREALRALGNISCAVVPLVKKGRWISNLGVYHGKPRQWTADEIRLLQETVERTWATVERARAEEALRESEERYRTLFGSMDEGFCIIEVLFDEQQRPVDYWFLEMNPAFERHTGLRDALGKTMREMAPGHEEHWFEIYGRIALTGEPERFENRAEALGGRWFEVYAFRVGEPEQRRVAILFNDATERKRADEALRESEQRFRAVADLVPDLLWRNDPSGNTDWYNQRWLEYTGQSLEEAGDGGWLEVIHPDDRERSFANFRAAIEAGRSLRQEYRIRRHDGRYRWFLVRANPVKGEDGRILQWFGAATDVHEHRTALEALRANEEWLGLAQRAARSGTWEWDLIDGEVRWSEEHRELFGFDPESPVTRERWWQSVHPSDLPLIEEAGRRCSEEGEEWPEIEYRIFREGETRWINARGRTVREGDRPVRILGISVDITERKQAEVERDRLLAQEWVARAEVAERERISRELHDRVAHSMGVAHQSLQLYEVFKESRPAQAAAKMALAKEMTKAALESTRNLSMELRRSEAEEGLVPALEDLLDVAVPAHIEAELDARGDEANIPPHVRGQLFAILREAVRNAVSHSGANNLRVELDLTPKAAVCAVEDDGRGLPERENGKNHGNAYEGGGLRSMRERAALLGGDLRLSSSLGNGTRMEVSVPLSEGA